MAQENIYDLLEPTSEESVNVSGYFFNLHKNRAQAEDRLSSIASDVTNPPNSLSSSNGTPRPWIHGTTVSGPPPSYPARFFSSSIPLKQKKTGYANVANLVTNPNDIRPVPVDPSTILHDQPRNNKLRIYHTILSPAEQMVHSMDIDPGEQIQTDLPTHQFEKENLQNEDLQKDDLQKDELQKENLQKENLQKEDLQKENLQKENPNDQNYAFEKSTKTDSFLGHHSKTDSYSSPPTRKSQVTFSVSPDIARYSTLRPLSLELQKSEFQELEGNRNSLYSAMPNHVHASLKHHNSYLLNAVVTRTPLLQKGRMFRDWNEEFQKIQGMRGSLDKYTQLRELTSDFEREATNIVGTIIGDLFLEPSDRTYKPLIAGIAGGEKYLHHNIFFKIAGDVQIQQGQAKLWLYGKHTCDTEKAMKTASHDFKSAASIFLTNLGFIHIPLILLIDYKGFRITAASKIPVTPNSTPLYGSCDGGVTLLRDPVLSEEVQKMAKVLNLDGDLKSGLKGEKFYGPVDIEGHQGTDGRYYLLDFARLFPPDAFSQSSGDYLTNLLRPELVQSNNEALASDAFSPFIGSDFVQQNAKVERATKRLYESEVPKFAAYFENLCNSEYDKSLPLGKSVKSQLKLLDQLFSEAHRFGV